MARFPLFGTAQRGRSVSVTAQRRINLYAEPYADPDRTRLAFFGTPGLSTFDHTAGSSVWRGLRPMGNSLWGVAGDTLYQLRTGVTKIRGTLSTDSGRVSMSDDGRYLVIADSQGGYVFDTNTNTFSTISDGDFNGADTVTFQGGYSIWSVPSSGQFQISALYDPTSYSGTDVATAESFPDDLVAVHVAHGQLVLFGAETTEWWGNVGTADFPFARVQGVAVEWGLHARWSVAKFHDGLAALMWNRAGQAKVVVLRGYQPQVISTPQLEYEMAGYAATSDASALVYNAAGHPFYQLNFPLAGKSWLYDGLTGLWSELQSGANGERHRAEHGAEYLDRTIVADYENGNLYAIDADCFTDAGTTRGHELVGRHIFNDERVSIGRLWLDMETGVGAVDGTPQAMLGISRDKGATYGQERARDIGAAGNRAQRVLWRRLGQSYDWTFRIRIAEPIKVAISGAWIDAS